MNWNQIEGEWKSIKGKAQQRWGKLTDDDLSLIEGKRDKLVGRLQSRYGRQRAELEAEVDKWIESV
jgi:uncharacterized protein YjbJ (UPF0337 family)